MNDQIPEKTTRRAITVFRIKKARIFWKKLISARTQLQMPKKLTQRDSLKRKV